MSTDALNFVKPRRTGSTGRKATLLVIADICDHHGVTYVGVDYLAEILECHRDTVIENLKKLRAGGHLVRIRRFKKGSGVPTSSLTVLAPFETDRGTMRPATAHPELGNLIAEYLADLDQSTNETKSGSSPHPKSGFPTSGSSETKSGFTPDEVGISDSTRQPTRQLDPSAGQQQRASADASAPDVPSSFPTLPSSGDDIDEIHAYLQAVANWCGDHPAREIRRFAQAWFGDAERVIATLANAQPAVRLNVARFLGRQATAGWKTPGMARQVAGTIMKRAEDDVIADARRGQTRDERRTAADQDHDAALDRLRESFGGGDQTGPAAAGYDYEVQPTDDVDPSDGASA